MKCKVLHHTVWDVRKCCFKKLLFFFFVYFSHSVGKFLLKRSMILPSNIFFRAIHTASSQWGAHFHSRMVLTNNALSRKILIFFIWFTEKKWFIYSQVIDIRDEPAQPILARPRRSLACYFSVYSWDTGLKSKHNFDSGFKNCLIKFGNENLSLLPSSIHFLL